MTTFEQRQFAHVIDEYPDAQLQILSVQPRSFMLVLRHGGEHNYCPDSHGGQRLFASIEEILDYLAKYTGRREVQLDFSTWQATR